MNPTDRPEAPQSEQSESVQHPESEAAKSKRPRGFAAMDKNLVREIARKGGKAAHVAGTAHEFNTEEARSAGRKGGHATHANRKKAQAEATR